MKRQQLRFRRFLDQSFARLYKVPPSPVDAAWERVLDRVREEPEGASRSAQAALDSVGPTPPVQMTRQLWVAAAAALVCAVALSLVLWPDRAPAVMDNVGGTLYRVVDGKNQELVVSESLEMGQVVRSNGGSGGALVLADGSRIEMKSQSELSLASAEDGVQISLKSGSVIVSAAKQQNGRHLYVQTKDVTVSVVGTVFLVNAEEEGSRVAVIEGEVRVKQREGERNLLQGEQVVTSPKMESIPVVKEIEWSRNAEAHVALLQQNKAPVSPAAAPSQPPTRPADTPKWEVVSIRPCGNPATTPGVRAGAMGTSPGELRVTCLAVRYLLRNAYVVWREEGMRFREDFPISGGPSWVDSELFTILAKAEGLPSDQQMKGPMLQALLEDRFRLKMRHEIREDSVYELRVADSGFKLQSLPEGECEKRETLSNQERETKGLSRLGIMTTLCSFTGIGGGPPGTKRIRQAGVPISDLIRNLALDRIVIDKTGLQGLYDYELTHGIANSPMREPKVFPPDVVGGESIFTALEKQLGLKLVPAKGPRSFYFIEHIEPPTPN